MRVTSVLTRQDPPVHPRLERAPFRQVGQQDNMPVHDQLPTSCWMPGEYISDPYAIQVAADAQLPLTVEVGLYLADVGTRLPRSDAPGDTVTLNVP